MDGAALLIERTTGLVQRLFDAFTQQVDEIEARMDADDAKSADDAKHLSGLARTLEVLLDLARKSSGAEAAPDVDALRGELAARMAQLLSAEPTRSADAGSV